MSQAAIDRADAGLHIARLMASIKEWDSDTLDAIAEMLDQSGLGERCPDCGLFKVPGEDCEHDDLHEAEFDIETGGTTPLEDALLAMLAETGLTVYPETVQREVDALLAAAFADDDG